MSTLFNGLNERQLEAVRDTVNQSALVLAGAGSGKTSVLTKRIAYLIELGVSPFQIMAITFTNKASLEMQERLASLIGEVKAKQVTMGTFHKICIRALKMFGDHIGVDRTFAIASPSDQQAAMKEALKEIGMESDAQSIKTYGSVISGIKRELNTPDRFLQSIQADGGSTIDTLHHKVYDRYQKILKKLNMLDFDDLILYSVLLLEASDTAREYFQKKYRYVSVDEYQDTDPSQYKLVQLISGKAMNTQSQPANVLCVGDVDQSIYKFRGSDIGIILSFQLDFPEAKIIKLEQNYRSTKPIVDIGNEIIKNNEERIDKTCFTANVGGEKAKIYCGYRSEDEAAFVAQEIKNLISFSGYEPKDIAILYRNNSLSRELEKELIGRQVPYQIIKGTSFFERVEIKDTMAYLKVVANPRDDIAMERVLGLTPSIGKTSIEKIKEFAASIGLSISESLKYFETNRTALKNAIENLRKLLTDLYLIYQISTTDKPEEQVQKILKVTWQRTEYLKKLEEKESEENKEKLKRLEELERIAVNYGHTVDEPSLVDFLESVTLQTSEDNEEEVNAVNLMTVHASKGLEYKVVFVYAFNDEIFPSGMSYQEEGGIEEERRLAYVAVTRAKERLYISYAKIRNVFGKEMWLKPSIFINEIPKGAAQRVG